VKILFVKKIVTESGKMV